MRINSRRALTLIVLFALALRFATALALGDRAEAISGAADQYTYDVLGQRVLAGYGFSFPVEWYPFTPANTQTAHWSFAYALYLAAVYAITGHHPLIARLLQALVSALSIVLVYRIGRRLFGELAGLAAALLAAGYAYLIFFNAALMTQTFYIVCLLAALDLALQLAEQPRRRDWLLLGATLGLGVLFRQTLLLFAPLLYLWIGWRVGFPRGRAQLRWRDLLLSLAVLAACIAQWTLRNALVYQDFLLLNSNGGYFLYSANHPQQGTNFDPDYAAPLPDELRGMNEAAEDRALYRAAFNFIASDPARFVLLSLNRTKDYFWLLPSEQSSLLSNLSRVFSFALYLPFMLAGLALSRAQWRLALPLYLYVALDSVVHLASWAAPRYRLPSDAVLMVFASLAVAALVEKARAFVQVRHAGLA
ncbi:MAG TPA: glycosyltransferase family 39 protein, partial [Chloroflexota bacterium]|nr:glycosyltransferase family 39 protein [Chloroflexota bacterium]